MRQQFGEIAYPSAFQPYGLLVQRGPLLIGKYGGIEVECSADQGAPLRDGLFVILVRKGVRPYKFFNSV